MAETVDVDKVRYVKRAIRRRYASRTNVDKIFHQYDKARKGYINAHDLYEKGNRMGLGMTLDEAQVLIKDALVKDKSGLQLGLNSA